MAKTRTSASGDYSSSERGGTANFERLLNVTGILAVTKEELLEICDRIGNNKAPGLDGCLLRSLKLS